MAYRRQPPPKLLPNAIQLTPFGQASSLLDDIEDFIAAELRDITSETQPMYPRALVYKKSKRKREPFLIKPLGTKKNRMVIGEMEYDPDLNVWMGNDGALNIFSPNTPGKILNMNRKDKARVVGEMVWDPKEKRWRGNERDLSRFEKKAPPLITHIPSDNVYFEPKQINGMVFDPINMRWTGNDTILDLFGDPSLDDALRDDGFVVGKEFDVDSNKMLLFKECEKDHNAGLRGWFSPDAFNKNYLYSIRTLSITRIVGRAHQPVDSKKPRTVTVAPSPKPSPHLLNRFGGGSNGVKEEWDDFSVDPSAGLELKLGNKKPTLISNNNNNNNAGSLKKSPSATISDSDEDWDTEFKLAETVKNLPLVTRFSGKGNNFTPNSSLKSISSDDDEDWDKEFGGVDSKQIKLIIPQPINLRTQRASPVHKVDDDSDSTDFEPSSGPLKLIKPVRDDDSEDGFDGFDDVEEEEQFAMSPEIEDGDGVQDMSAEEEIVEIEDDDWDDVDIPTTIATLKPRHSEGHLETWDDDKEIQIQPNKQLQLKARPASTKIEAVPLEEEDWEDGLVIPAGGLHPISAFKSVIPSQK